MGQQDEDRGGARSAVAPAATMTEAEATDPPHDIGARATDAAETGTADDADEAAPASETTADATAEASEMPADATAEASEMPADATVEAAPAPPRAPAIPITLLLLVTVVNLGLALGLFALRPPQRVERVVGVPAMPVPVAQLAAQVQRGEHGAAYDLVLTDDDLSATAGYFLAQSKDVPFSQVRVTVGDGHVEATAVTTGTAVSVPVRIQANVIAGDGIPVVQVIDVTIGGMPLPAFAHEQVLREANRAVDLSRYDLPVTIDSIALRPGVLDVRGTVK
jgi:hypothetical protein